MAVRVGVVLSGCGVFDGSEIHEAVSVLVALDRREAQIMCMAPDVPAETINHLTRQPTGQQRRVLEEAARIARGKVRDMASVQPTELDAALVFPGGFGAAKNLCTFATDDAQCKVNEQVERLILAMVKGGKPIGLACIAPVIAVRVLGKAGLKPVLTIGTDRATAAAMEAMGAEHRESGETEICVDHTNKLVSTPCYMNNVGPWTVYQGADRMVEEVLRLAQR